MFASYIIVVKKKKKKKKRKGPDIVPCGFCRHFSCFLRVLLNMFSRFIVIFANFLNAIGRWNFYRFTTTSLSEKLRTVFLYSKRVVYTTILFHRRSIIFPFFFFFSFFLQPHHFWRINFRDWKKDYFPWLLIYVSFIHFSFKSNDSRQF